MASDEDLFGISSSSDDDSAGDCSSPIRGDGVEQRMSSQGSSSGTCGAPAAADAAPLVPAPPAVAAAAAAAGAVHPPPSVTSSTLAQQQPKGPSTSTMDPLGLVAAAATSQSRAQQQPGSQPTTLDPLGLVLGHLSGPDGNPQQYNTAARGLHRTSRHYQSEARATQRHLDLAAYYRGLVSAYPDPATRPAAMPWDMLAACPGITSWRLDQQQLACFTAATEEQLAAAASKLRHLKVIDTDVFQSSPMTDEQQEGMGRLLWACRQLQGVEMYLSKGPTKPWLLRDPNSSSLDTAVAPPLPRSVWASTGIPYEFLTSWVWQQEQQQQQQQQEQPQQQLSRTLQAVVMHDAGQELALDSLAALRGLRHLDISGSGASWSINSSSPTVLSSMSSVTKLLGKATAEAAELACGLPGLQHLRLWFGTLQRLPHGIAALKQLSALEVSSPYLRELPADLGVQLPRLERLAVKQSPLTGVPATLTRLTHLDISGDWQVTEQLSLPSSLGRLQQLSLARSKYTSIVGLSHLTALQLLDLGHVRGVETNLASLLPLARLRHLDVMGWTWHRGAYRVLDRLVQLTHLAMCIEWKRPMQMLPPPLRNLQVLRVLNEGQPHPMGDVAALLPWLVQLRGLTQLWCRCSHMATDGDLLYLPPRLQQLEWFQPRQPTDLLQLPRGLTRLSDLKTLIVSNFRDMCELPEWLSDLRSLEVFRFSHKGEPAVQEVLGQMPALRRVTTRTWKGEAATLLASAPHLHFYHGP